MAHQASATTLKRKFPDSEETSGMCANSCGFYGAAVTGNMCSKCYKVKEYFGSEVSTAPPEKKIKTIDSVASSDGAELSLASTTKQPTAATCRKKVGLLGFRCRCEGTFCSVHRYSDKHTCGFDYKIAGQEQIAKDNPVVIADKIATRI